MKKFYLTGVILMIGLVSFGQSRPEKPRSKQFGEKIKTSQRTNIEAQRSGGGGAIWSDDFSDPSTWVIEHDATACSLDWEIGVNLGSGGPVPIDTIQSTTKFNGYAMIDSDEYGGENGGSETEDCWFTTASPIDLSGNPNVVLEFETQYYKWTYEECYVVISTNNTDWPELTPDTDISGMPNVFYVWPGMDTQDNVDNPTLKRINISEACGDSSTVWIRFHWTGTWGYTWFVDDVKIVTQPQDEIIMESAYVSHNNTAYEFGRIPAAQTGQDILIGSAVYNFGATTQYNLSFNADFTGPTPFSASVMVDSLESDSTAFMEDASNNPALGIGVYNGTYSVVSDGDSATGANYYNNIGSRNFEVTNNSYTLDGIGVYPDNNLASIGTGNFTDATDGLWLFTFYDIVGSMTIEGIELALNTSANSTISTVPGGVLRVALHDTADIWADNVSDAFESSELITVTQAHVNEGFIFIPFENPVVVTDRPIYAGVELFSDNGTTHISILDDETVPQPGDASAIFISGDQSYGNGTALAIRLNRVDTEVGIEEHGDLASMTISPNPSNGLVSIKFNLESASSLDIQVVGIDGATVAALSTDRVAGSFNQNMDLSDLANGVYFVKVATDNGIRTEKIMIAK